MARQSWSYLGHFDAPLTTPLTQIEVHAQVLPPLYRYLQTEPNVKLRVKSIQTLRLVCKEFGRVGEPFVYRDVVFPLCKGPHKLYNKLGDTERAAELAGHVRVIHAYDSPSRQRVIQPLELLNVFPQATGLFLSSSDCEVLPTSPLLSRLVTLGTNLAGGPFLNGAVDLAHLTTLSILCIDIAHVISLSDAIESNSASSSLSITSLSLGIPTNSLSSTVLPIQRIVKSLVTIFPSLTHVNLLVGDARLESFNTDLILGEMQPWATNMASARIKLGKSSGTEALAGAYRKNFNRITQHNEELCETRLEVGRDGATGFWKWRALREFQLVHTWESPSLKQVFSTWNFVPRRLIPRPPPTATPSSS